MRCTVRCIEENAHEECAWTCCWVPDSNSLLTGSGDETVRVWTATPDEIKHEKTISGLAGCTLGVVSVSVDLTGKWAASSALDSYVRVWSLANETEQRALLESMPTEVWDVKFCPVRDRCIIAAAGGTLSKVKLWDITSLDGTSKAPAPEPHLFDIVRRLLPEILPFLSLLSQAPPAVRCVPWMQAKTAHAAEQEFLLSVAFSPDGRTMACASMSGIIYVFNLETKQQVLALTGHFKPIRSIVFTPDSKFILSACDDMQVHMYDTHSGNLIEAFSGHESWVLGVDVHPDGVHFCSSSSDHSVKIWDMSQRTCVSTTKEHRDQVWSVVFSSDGSTLASCGDDGRLITYNVQ